MILQHALLDNKIVHVDKVINGAKSGCICPACKSDLIAKNKGIRRLHHFAHLNQSDCSRAYESSVHYLAKKIISEEKVIYTPRLYEVINDSNSRLLRDEKVIEFTLTMVEKNLGNFIPDIVGYYDNERVLAIEFKVSHEVDQIKRQKVISRNIDLLEIDLSDYHSINESILRKLLTKRNEKSKWIHNRLVEQPESSKVLPNKYGISDDSHYQDSNYTPDIVEDISKYDCGYMKNAEGKSIFDIWNSQETSFLAVNIKTEFAVHIFENPHKHYAKYGKVYGILYRYGKYLGNREIYGIFDMQWRLVGKKGVT